MQQNRTRALPPCNEGHLSLELALDAVRRDASWLTRHAHSFQVAMIALFDHEEARFSWIVLVSIETCPFLVPCFIASSLLHRLIPISHLPHTASTLLPNAAVSISNPHDLFSHPPSALVCDCGGLVMQVKA